MPRRTRYMVDRDKKSGDWHGKRGKDVIVRGSTKQPVVKKVVAAAKKDRAAQVVIKKADGKIQEERTYPRGSDPRRSKG